MPPADERELAKLIGELAPQLLRQPRISNVLAAEIYNAWSHPDAFVPRRHFATLPGVAPIPASSGQVVRHRLNRSGDRRLNRALRPLVTACDPEMDVALPCYRSGEVDPIIPDEGNEVAWRPPVT